MNYPQPRGPTPVSDKCTPTPYIPMVRVTSSNPEFSVAISGDSRSVVRVYIGKTLIAQEYVHKRSPYEHLKTLKRSKHIESLRRQLSPYGITVNDIGLYDYKLEVVL